MSCKNSCIEELKEVSLKTKHPQNFRQPQLSLLRHYFNLAMLPKAVALPLRSLAARSGLLPHAITNTFLCQVSFNADQFPNTAHHTATNAWVSTRERTSSWQWREGSSAAAFPCQNQLKIYGVWGK